MVLTNEQSDMVAENHNLIYWYANFKGLDIEEWYDVLAIELCRTIIKYNSKLGSLSNYYKLRADGVVSKEFRKRNAKKRYHVPVEYADEYMGEEVDHDLLELENWIDGSESDVLKLKFQGYSQKEISTMLGISQSYVSIMLKRLREKLNDRQRVR